MYKNKTFLAIIPARGGSRGLPGKNIKELCGKPLIAWSIESGLKSKYIDEVIVSTDYKTIADIAKEYGSSVPFLRPGHLASDTATSFDVVKHAVDFYKDELGKEFDCIVLLEPTSPLRTTQDIDMAIKLLLSSSATSVVGICKTEEKNPAFLVHMDQSNYISGYENEDMRILRRQDVKNIYFFEGSIYISYIKTYLYKQTFYHESTIGFEFTKYKSLEIDDMADFIMVEAMMKSKGYK